MKKAGFGHVKKYSKTGKSLFGHALKWQKRAKRVLVIC